MTVKDDFVNLVKESGRSTEQVDLMLCSVKYFEVEDCAMEILLTISHIVAMSAVGVTNQEDFIKEIAFHAIQATRYANAMTGER